MLPFDHTKHKMLFDYLRNNYFFKKIPENFTPTICATYRTFNGAHSPQGSQPKRGQTEGIVRLKRGQTVDVSAVYQHFTLSCTLTPLQPHFSYSLTPIHSLSSLYPRLSTHYHQFNYSLASPRPLRWWSTEIPSQPIKMINPVFVYHDLTLRTLSVRLS